MRRDSLDRRRPERTILSFAASLLLHALVALFLFSLATSSSQQASPESFANGAIVTVTRQVVPVQPRTPVRVPPPIPHVPVVRPVPHPAAQTQAQPPHPRVLHELAKNVPTAAPNPTPAPVSSVVAVIPAPTQAPQIAVSAAPIAPAAPTSVPLAVTAAAVRVPPTAAPTQAPKPAPTLAPAKAPQPSPAPRPKAPVVRTPLPEPSALAATAVPVAALAQPQSVVTPGSARVPAPRATASPGHAPGYTKSRETVARPVQVPPATPHPATPVTAKTKRAATLNARLQSLIPTAGPSPVIAPPKHTHFVVNLRVTPPPEPTPPPQVLASTKYIYTEDIASQHWKHWPLGSSPEEVAVKMYVTSMHRIGPIQWCNGWVIRLPVPPDRSNFLPTSDRDLTPVWIIEPNQSFICGGHLEPFTQPSPEPTTGS